MSEFKSELSLDASQAIAELNRLDAAMKNVQGANAAFAKSFGRLTQSTAKTEAALGRTAKNLDNAKKQADQAAKSVKNLTISWETMARVVVTQAIVRALSQFRNALSGAVAQANEFQTAIAELQTIASDIGSFEELSNVALEVSNNFNIGLIDATRAAYQGVSNQVIKTADDFQFLNQAALFAKATNSSLEDSVNLLSGTLNAFGKETSETNEVASVFFKTIELGKTRADELAGSFGRVSPLADQLSIRFAELSAAVATLTIQGVKTNEAVTQLRGIMTGLIKPSTEMQIALRDLGFQEAQTAIQTLGFDGVLKALGDRAGGSAEELAKLFPRVRGLTGALILGTKAAGLFSTNIEKTSSVSASLAAQKGFDVLATDAQLAEKAVNRLKNALAEEFGSAVLAVGASLEQVGIANFLTDQLIAVGPAATSAALGLSAAAAATKLATAGFGSLSLAVRGAGLALLALGAVEVGDQIGKFIADGQTKDLTDLLARELARRKALTDSLNQQLTDQKQHNEKLLRENRNLLRPLNKIYLDNVDAFKAANSSMLDDAKSVLGRIAKLRGDVIRSLEKSADDSASAVEDSQQRISDLLQKRDERNFQATIGDDLRGLRRLQDEAQRVAKRAAGDLASAITPKDIQSALDKFSRAESLTNQSAELAKQLGNRFGQVKAAKLLNSLVTDQVNAEQTLSQIQKTREESARAEIERQRQVSAEIKKQSEIFLDNTSLLDAQGNQFSSVEQERRQKLAAAALAKLTKSAFDQENFDISDIIGLGRLQDRLSERTFKLKAELEIVNADALKLTVEGRQITKQNPQNLANDLNASLKRLDEIQAKLNAAQIEASNLAARQKAFGEFVGQSIPDDASSRFASKDDISRLAAIRQQIIDLTKQKFVTPKQIEDANRLIDQLKDPATGLQKGQFNELNALKNALLAIEKIQTSGDAVVQQGLLNIAKANEEETVKRLITLIKEKNRLEGGGSAQGRMFGGLLRAGGGPAGTDRISAILSPGEFVVNARSSRQFFSELQAINANPVRRAEGGPINNSVSVGDIVIQGGTDGQSTAREVIRQIKREFRRTGGSF